ncbi:hypothetical protein GLOIN_2v1642012 [Rhizophagus clarus]|uniref:Uncharacterized protein n=1 Tax=Rhizophagus clarus TaxID=94130 RepID=A0A8H3LYX9_9GLOM|nr:hypothetical protein GLOIN_2v1642012 [Rhizophagus clarus]
MVVFSAFFFIPAGYREENGQGIGFYCGGELSFTGGGDDCGWNTLWNCSSKGQMAEATSPCVYGCCGITHINSFCCTDIGCTGCSEPYPAKSPQNPTTSSIISTSTIPATLPQITMPPTLPLPEITKIVIGTVSGVVGTALIMSFGMISYKWYQRRQNRWDDVMRIPGNNTQKHGILRIPGNNTQKQDGILKIPGEDTSRNKPKPA